MSSNSPTPDQTPTTPCGDDKEDDGGNSPSMGDLARSGGGFGSEASVECKSANSDQKGSPLTPSTISSRPGEFSSTPGSLPNSSTPPDFPGFTPPEANQQSTAAIFNWRAQLDNTTTTHIRNFANESTMEIFAAPPNNAIWRASEVFGGSMATDAIHFRTSMLGNQLGRISETVMGEDGDAGAVSPCSTPSVLTAKSTPQKDQTCVSAQAGVNENAGVVDMEDAADTVEPIKETGAGNKPLPGSTPMGVTPKVTPRKELTQSQTGPSPVQKPNMSPVVEGMDVAHKADAVQSAKKSERGNRLSCGSTPVVGTPNLAMQNCASPVQGDGHQSVNGSGATGAQNQGAGSEGVECIQSPGSTPSVVTQNLEIQNSATTKELSVTPVQGGEEGSVSGGEMDVVVETVQNGENVNGQVPQQGKDTISVSPGAVTPKSVGKSVVGGDDMNVDSTVDEPVREQNEKMMSASKSVGDGEVNGDQMEVEMENAGVEEQTKGTVAGGDEPMEGATAQKAPAKRHSEPRKSGSAKPRTPKKNENESQKASDEMEGVAVRRVSQSPRRSPRRSLKTVQSPRFNAKGSGSGEGASIESARRSPRKSPRNLHTPTKGNGSAKGAGGKTEKITVRSASRSPRTVASPKLTGTGSGKVGDKMEGTGVRRGSRSPRVSLSPKKTPTGKVADEMEGVTVQRRGRSPKMAQNDGGEGDAEETKRRNTEPCIGRRRSSNSSEGIWDAIAAGRMTWSPSPKRKTRKPLPISLPSVPGCWEGDVRLYLEARINGSHEINTKRYALVESLKSNHISSTNWWNFLSYEESIEDSQDGFQVALDDVLCSGEVPPSLYGLYQWAFKLIPVTACGNKDHYIALMIGYARQKWIRSKEEGIVFMDALCNLLDEYVSADVVYERACMEFASGKVDAALKTVQEALQWGVEPRIDLEKAAEEIINGGLQYAPKCNLSGGDWDSVLRKLTAQL